jgi:hypothetical protein
LDQFFAEERILYAHGLLNSALEAVKAGKTSAKKQTQISLKLEMR